MLIEILYLMLTRSDNEFVPKIQALVRHSLLRARSH
jgi:hypothetical protein